MPRYDATTRGSLRTVAGSLGVGKYDANDNFSLVQFDPAAGTSGDWKQLTPLQDTSDTANG